MKRAITIALCCLTALLMLAACGNSPSTTPPQSNAPASTAPSQPASAPSGQASGSDAVAGPTKDIASLVATLAEAASLGTTIPVMDIDLRAGGVNTDNIVEFAGAESQISAENGGIVIVIYAQPGMADTLATEMESFRESRMGNPDYADFENARTNTQNARIKTFGDYVVYAVSATGHEGGWDALDAAIDAAFA